MGLCTVAQFKTQYSWGVDTADDTLLAQIIAGVSARFARAAGRVSNGVPCLEITTWGSSSPLILNVPEARSEWLWLPAWPIVSVTKVQESHDCDWDNADALTLNEDYKVDAALGGLYRMGFWYTGIQTVRIETVGGYTAAGDTPGTGETALPDDVVDAAIEQVGYAYQNRHSLGLTSVSGGGGSVARALDGLGLLDGVRRVAEGLRRIAT